jgi:hypothetical protein
VNTLLPHADPSPGGRRVDVSDSPSGLTSDPELRATAKAVNSAVACACPPSKEGRLAAQPVQAFILHDRLD